MTIVKTRCIVQYLFMGTAGSALLLVSGIEV